MAAAAAAVGVECSEGATGGAGPTNVGVVVAPDCTVADLAHALQERLNAEPCVGSVPLSRVLYFVHSVERGGASDSAGNFTSSGAATAATPVAALLGTGDVTLELVTEAEFEAMPEAAALRKIELRHASAAASANATAELGAAAAARFGNEEENGEDEDFFASKKQKKKTKSAATKRARSAPIMPAVTASGKVLRLTGAPGEKEPGSMGTDADGRVVVWNVSCHRCKTRKQMCFLCPAKMHRICPTCLMNHHKLKFIPDGACPVCTRTCTCALCKKKKHGASAAASDDDDDGDDE